MISVPRLHPSIRILAVVVCAVACCCAPARAQFSGFLDTIVTFDGTNGAYPTSGLLPANDGSFYGTTESGGLSGTGGGTVYKFSPPGSAHTGAAPLISDLHDFNFDDGIFDPVGGVIQASDGNLYGMIDGGNPITNLPYYAVGGSIFRVSPEGEFTDLFQFEGTNGASPAGPLVQGSDGYLYGATTSGGPTNLGTLFRISTNGTFDSLYGFDTFYGLNPAYGYTPNGGLVEGPDGIFYGTTYSGGPNGQGTIFSITTSGVYTNLLFFNGTNGALPSGSLVLGADGALYGTTSQGGPSLGDTNSVNGAGMGTIFKFSTNGVLTVLYAFYGTNGSYPSSIIQGTDGRLYGATLSGGAYTNVSAGIGTPGYGTLFGISTNGEFTLLYSFDNTNGAAPLYPPVQAADGTFYATTTQGGAYGMGTICHFNVPLPPTFNLPGMITNECGGFPAPLLFVGIRNNSGDQLTAIWNLNQQPVQTNTFSSDFTFVPFPSVSELPLGTNIVALSVSNSFGDTSSASTVVMIVETNPPVIGAAVAIPPTLWPPNGRMVNVTMEALVGEHCGAVTEKIINVTSPGATPGNNRRGGLWDITGDHSVSLRAEPGIGGQQRVYYVTLQATDESGLVSQPRVVAVPVAKPLPSKR